MKKSFKSRIFTLVLAVFLILANASFLQITVSATSLIYKDSSSSDWIANLPDVTLTTAQTSGGWRNGGLATTTLQIGTFDATNGKSIRITTPPGADQGKMNYYKSALPNTEAVTYTDIRSEEFKFKLNAGTNSSSIVYCQGFRFAWDGTSGKWKIEMNGLKDNRAAGGVNWATKVAALVTPDVPHTFRMVQKETNSGTVWTITDMYVDGVRVTAATDGTIFPATGQPAAFNFMEKYAASGFGWFYYCSNPAGATSNLIFDLYEWKYNGMNEPMNVTSTTPIGGAYAFPRNGSISVTFDNDINTNTLNTDNVSIAPANNPTQKIAYTGGSYDSVTKTYSIDLTNTPLAYKTDYVLTVNTSVASTDGKVLVAPYTVNFSTTINYTYKSSSSVDSIENAPLGNLGQGAYNGGWRNLTTNTSTFSAITFGTFDEDGKACRITTKPGDVGQLYYFNTGLPQPPLVTYTPVRAVEWQFKIGAGYDATSHIDCMGFNFLWDVASSKWLLRFNGLSAASGWYNKPVAYITPGVKYSLKIVQRDDSASSYTLLGIYLNNQKITTAIDGTIYPVEGKTTSMNIMEKATTGTWAFNKCYNPLASTQDLVYDIYTLQYYGLTPMFVSSATPSNGSTDVMLNGTIAITFDNDINPATLTTDNITIAPKNNPTQKVNYNAGTYNSSTKTYSINLSSTPLAANTKYVLTINKSVESVDGYTLIDNYELDFSTSTVAFEGIHFYKDSQEISAIQSGSIECQVALVSNIGSQSTTMIAALYKQNQGLIEMIDTVVTDVQLGASGVTTVTPTLNVPEIQVNEQYFIKLFVWNGLTNIESLATSKTFNNVGVH